MTHRFLSDEWFAALAELIDRDGRPEIQERLRDMVVNIDATDGDQVIAATYRGFYFEPGHSDDARATLTTPRDLCYEVLVEKKMALGVRALASGQAKLKGDRTKLMPLRAIRSTPDQAEFERKVREMTEV